MSLPKNTTKSGKRDALVNPDLNGRKPLFQENLNLYLEKNLESRETGILWNKLLFLVLAEKFS